MSKGQNSGGLTPSTGLIHYFDAEDRNTIRANPKTIFTAGALLGIGVPILNSFAS